MDNQDSPQQDGSRRGYIPAACVRFIEKLQRKSDETNSDKNKSDPYGRGIYLATWVIAAAGILTFGAAIIQACIFFGQLGAMRSTDEAVHTLAAAALKQAEGINKQVIVMQGQLDEMKAQRLFTIAQLRANLRSERPRFTGVDANGQTGDKVEKIIGWAVSPAWKNVGATDATNVRGLFEIRYFNGRPNNFPASVDCPSLPRPKPNEAPTFTIQRDGELFLFAQAITAERINRVAAGLGYILMFGLLEYRDVFPETHPHHQDWCVAIIPNDPASPNQRTIMNIRDIVD